MKKLAIVTTHPIQYNAPLFRLIHERGNINIKVFYTWGKAVLNNKFDPGFEREVQWDIPLLEGYHFSFEMNIASKPGSHHFHGIWTPELIGNIENWGADAVLVYGWSFKSHLSCIRYFHNKIPVLFRGDSTMLDTVGNIRKIFRRIFLQWIYQFVDLALYTGTENKKYFKAHGMEESRLSFVPHCVDNKRFLEPATLAENNLRLHLNIPPTGSVMLYAGKLEPKKNVGLLIDTFIKLKDANCWLVIAGSGSEEHILKAKIANEKNIILLDFQNQSQMPALYQMADTFILPSKGPGETWGLAVNEAMASGLAVVVSNKAGCAIDLVNNNVNGYIFDPGKPEMLYHCLALLTDRSHAHLLGKQSQALINDWSQEEAAKSIEDAVKNQIKTIH